ncbi:hypothetical protein [Nannocystis bainbridge]|uniref:Uncharacterized protein n=1 Tax=Nannocystis bainbridge TaxID=2995303 RepID=A0ABT5EBU4_9BACT|nr:hypothetical protein [Nannocystis bainbridge]MDC0722799.1 hypothetical protein [Nannocystis bainbridge]
MDRRREPATDPEVQPLRSQVEASFEQLWQAALEPALRAGHELDVAAVEARMGPHPLLKAQRRYRELSLDGDPFIARLSLDGLACEHLWPAPPLPDRSSLVVRFPTAAALAGFRATAERAQREPAELAASVLVSFAPGDLPGPPARPRSSEYIGQGPLARQALTSARS